MSEGFTLHMTNYFINLSPNNPNNYDVIEGLLYVPTLDAAGNASCANALSVIPNNVTSLASFPHQDYPLIALFPWTTSSECTDAYLAQSRADAVRGALVYQLSGGNYPPPVGALSWLLNGSSAWTSENQYGIYGIGANAGASLMTQLALYSGNMTSAPNGVQLDQQYDGRDFPRLFTQIELTGGANAPSLWVFLIIVLAVLLGIVILASIIMHLIQRRQRTILQRRLERGEVDLETLGIKKMNVPQEKIDEMPKYVFTGDAAAPTTAPSSPTKSPQKISTVPQTSFSQTTCPICLDDFVGGETEVRELPCKHIFHPECIDLFLRDNSSLCPMCKKSALPAGYCPVKVTNLMVRRERLVRRMRERRRLGINPAVNGSVGTPTYSTTKAQYVWLWIQRKLRFGHGTPAASAPAGAQITVMREQQRGSVVISDPSASHGDIEMGPTTTGAGRSSSQPLDSVPNPLQARRQTMAVPPHIAAQGAAARRAWRRERLAQQQEQAYNQQAQTVREVDESRPFWRRVVGRVAPGIA